MESHRFRGARSSLEVIHWNEALPSGNELKGNCQSERETVTSEIRRRNCQQCIFLMLIRNTVATGTHDPNETKPD